MPSNLGRGPAVIQISERNPRYAGPKSRTPQCKLWTRVAASLVVSDQSKNDTEARGCQQAAILCVSYLPYLESRVSNRGPAMRFDFCMVTPTSPSTCGASLVLSKNLTA